MYGPLIDWNGNGQIDPSDIAISLAMVEEEEANDENEDEQRINKDQYKIFNEKRTKK